MPLNHLMVDVLPALRRATAVATFAAGLMIQSVEPRLERDGAVFPDVLLDAERHGPNGNTYVTIGGVGVHVGIAGDVVSTVALNAPPHGTDSRSPPWCKCHLQSDLPPRDPVNS
jgi:hypothetical protein